MNTVAVCRSKVSLSDITNGYIYVLFGFFAHLYIIFSTSLYFSLEDDLQHLLGLSKETIINYFALFTIILLLFSLANKWTWPIKVEEAVIVICIWILLRNLLPRDCVCCSPPPSFTALATSRPDGQAPTPAPNPYVAKEEATLPREQESRPPDLHTQTLVVTDCETFTLLYSVLCVLVMIASFLMNARSPALAALFAMIAIVLMIYTTLVPVSCNQFNQANVNNNLLKFTLYSIVWFNKRRKRLTEQVLSSQYLKGMRILYSYDDHQSNHLLCGVKHNTSSKKRKQRCVTTTTTPRHLADQCDEIAYVIGEEESLVPRSLFARLEALCCSVIRPGGNSATSSAYKGRVDVGKARDFACQVRNIKRVCEIHNQFNERRLFGDFFSWKNRCYDMEIQNIFDLTQTLWILNVCPVFLIFVLLEYLLVNYHTHCNIKELSCLIRRIKVMSHIRCDDL